MFSRYTYAGWFFSGTRTELSKTSIDRRKVKRVKCLPFCGPNSTHFFKKYWYLVNQKLKKKTKKNCIELGPQSGNYFSIFTFLLYALLTFEILILVEKKSSVHFRTYKYVYIDFLIYNDLRNMYTLLAEHCIFFYKMIIWYVFWVKNIRNPLISEIPWYMYHVKYKYTIHTGEEFY